jgi:hypothetical protein
MKSLSVPVDLDITKCLSADPNEVMQGMFKQTLDCLFEEGGEFKPDNLETMHQIWSSGYMTAVAMIRMCQVLNGKKRTEEWIDSILANRKWRIETFGEKGTT